MADVKFNQLRYNIGFGFDWTAAGTYFVLLDVGTWTPDPDDDVVQDAIAAGAVDAGLFTVNRTQIINPVVTLDDAGNRALWGLDDFNYPAPALGQDYNGLLHYNLVNDDTDSWLLGYWDITPGVGDGVTPVSITIPGGNLYAW